MDNEIELETFPRSNRSDPHRYVYQSIFDFQQANDNPIDGYENEEIVSLEEAVQPLIPLINQITDYVIIAKNECKRYATNLTWDQSAVIYLYTMPTPFFSHLNTHLRDEDRHALRPWFSCLKLLITALQRLPSSHVKVWRGVLGDVGSFPNGYVTIWWSINSTSKDLNVVVPYVGTGGTLFHIESIHGKIISEYAAIQDENEVILLPGTRLRVISYPGHFFDRLLVVDLIEEEIIENQSKDDPENHVYDDMNVYSALLRPENPFAIPPDEPYRRRTFRTNVNPLVYITIAIGLLYLAMIYLYFSNQQIQSTRKSSTTIDSTLTSTYCFSVGWNSTGNVVAAGGYFNAFAIDDQLNIYVTNQSEGGSLEKWSPDGQFIARFFDKHFQIGNFLFFHSASQSLYFTNAMSREPGIFQFYIQNLTLTKVENQTVLNTPPWYIQTAYIELYVTSNSDIYIYHQSVGVIKWNVSSSSGVLVADGHTFQSAYRLGPYIIHAAIDERNNVIYILDSQGPRVLKYIDGSPNGTAIIDRNPREAFLNVNLEPFSPMKILVDQSGYFLLIEHRKITMWTPDGKYNITIMTRYRTVHDQKDEDFISSVMTFDKLGNFYAVDREYKRVIKFNRTNATQCSKSIS